MATVEWTDARLNDAFEALRADLAQMRAEMRADREELRAEMRTLRADMRADMHGVRAEMSGFADRVHADLRLMWVTIATTYGSFVAAFVATQL